MHNPEKNSKIFHIFYYTYHLRYWFSSHAFGIINKLEYFIHVSCVVYQNLKKSCLTKVRHWLSSHAFSILNKLECLVHGTVSSVYYILKKNVFYFKLRCQLSSQAFGILSKSEYLMPGSCVKYLPKNCFYIMNFIKMAEPVQSQQFRIKRSCWFGSGSSFYLFSSLFFIGDPCITFLFFALFLVTITFFQ